MGTNTFIGKRIDSLQRTFTAINMRGIYYLALFCFMMLFTATKADMVTDDEDMAMGSGGGEEGTTEGGKSVAVTEKPAEPEKSAEPEKPAEPAEPAPEEKTEGFQ